MSKLRNSLATLATCAILSNPAMAQKLEFNLQDGDLEHIKYSAAVHTGIYRTLSFLDYENSETIAFFGTLGIGLGKELIWDYAFGKGTPHIRDMKFNLIGLGLSIGANKALDWALKRNEKKRVKHRNYRNRLRKNYRNRYTLG